MKITTLCYIEHDGQYLMLHRIKKENDINDTKEHYIRKIFEPFLKNSASYEKDYIEKRLIEQIIWYDESAIKKQKRYKQLSIISIVLSGIIPIVSIFSKYKYGTIAIIIISTLSALSSILLSIINLCVEYRSACEILKSTLYKYFTKTDEFQSLNDYARLNLLISLCECYSRASYRSSSVYFPKIL